MPTVKAAILNATFRPRAAVLVVMPACIAMDVCQGTPTMKETATKIHAGTPTVTSAKQMEDVLIAKWDTSWMEIIAI